MALTESLVDVALRELDSTTCVCGATKGKRKSFCQKCYFSLPRGLRNRLYKPISEGYAEIYDGAKDFLRQETSRLG